MNKFLCIAYLAAGLMLATLAGCGGGGGGGSSGTASLPYTGNTSAADITATNASGLTANVIGGDATATILGASTTSAGVTPVQGSGITDVTRRLSRDLRNVEIRANREASNHQIAQGALQPVDVTFLCDGMIGTMHVFGTIDDQTELGTVTVDFTDCALGITTVNGRAVLRVDAFDLVNFVPTDSTFSFDLLNLRMANIANTNIDASGTIRDQLSIATNTETITINGVQRDNSTNLMTRSVDFRFIDVYDNIVNPTSFTSTVSGRVFDSVNGFVDVTTVTPLVFGTLSQSFPDGGEMLLTGAGSKTIRVTAVNSTLVQLQLDTDGNSTVDNTARLKWTELGGPVGADLRDADSDGMHNSWEVFHGLDANVDDAAGDNDSDGITNLNEYLAGTDPTP